MKDRTFVAWVEPIATVLAGDAASFASFARSSTEAFWRRPSPVDGWMNRDILAHVAGGNDQVVQTALQSVVTGAILDPAALDPDTDGENARRIEERRGWTTAALLDEFDGEHDRIMELLSRLSSEDESKQPGGANYTLGQLMRIVAQERHTYLHLEQLRSSTT